MIRHGGGHNHIEWGPGAFERATMRPMEDVTWDNLLALPEGTEVLAIFVAPLGVALKGLQFFMDTQNRQSIENWKAAGNVALPNHVSYVLPSFDLDPNMFLTEERRKDADSDD
jgi:hypothetical protein